MSLRTHRDMRDLQCKFIAFNVPRTSPRKAMSLPFNAGKCGFGGATVRSEGSNSNWNKLFVIGENGLLLGGKKTKLAELSALHTSSGIDDVRVLMRQLMPFTMASCSLKITNASREGYMSGVWIQSSSGRYSAVTCAHYFKDSNENVIDPEPGIDEAIITSSRERDVGEPIRCRLRDFDSKHDWAIFAPVDQQHAQQEVSYAILHTYLNADMDIDKKNCFSVGYNYATSDDEFQKEAKAVQSDRNPLHELPAMVEYLHPEERTIATGNFDMLGDDVCHNVPGWYGISGAPMFTFENKIVQLVCLFQGGRLKAHYKDNYHPNKAVRVQEDMVKSLKDF